jgi:hypothetical protein
MHKEPTVEQLRDGPANDMVELYAAKLVADHRELIDRYGAARYAAADLVPRGIITTKQELDAFLAIASRPARHAAGTCSPLCDACVELLERRRRITVSQADASSLNHGACASCRQLIGNYHAEDCALVSA